ncbi:homeobox-leucine zipper protein ATHB-12-like [Pistacia vera]|uniref:homeobox-leucine zipper protein ATHB-12-like n=1 Tax=Pistacia vera TaxID=55513 RepID=UPI001263DDDF|nr:homeobox-leucine zipper protein ATHB-12-like [Pistacia vera]
MQQITSKRKFSDEQIKTLEFMFESESRPESRIKQQLADELGLQPRQVAIWFQNRRARLKTKQIELDYSKLKAKFDTLASSYESLKEEHHSLLVQLQTLKTMLERCQHGAENSVLDHNEICRDVKCENEDTTTESKEVSMLVSECNDHVGYEPYGDDKKGNAESTVENTAVINIEGHTKSSVNWCNFESSFLEESSSTSEWWEFWS